MKCFQCQKGKMLVQLAEMTAHVRGEQIPVRSEASVCNRCGFQVLTDEQSNAYTIASADAYREKHSLLTTRDLKEIRQRLGISLRDFAKYLRVGEASPKRWEAGLVQDEAMDELIRVKTDLVSARQNVEKLESRLGLKTTGPQIITLPMPRRTSVEPKWPLHDEANSLSGLRFPSDFIRKHYLGT